MEEDASVVSFVVEDMTGTQQLEMKNVLTRPTLNIGLGNIAKEQELARFAHLNNIELPDVDVNDVHLLIGQDLPEALIPLEVRTGGTGEPYATRTKLGWTLNGPVSRHPNQQVAALFTKTDADLQQQVVKFWELDKPPGTDENSLSISDRKVLSIWEDSITKDGSHYMMDIPFKQRPPPLSNNYTMAERRLQSLGKRLSNDEDLKKKYTKAIEELFDKGYAESIPDEELNKENDSGVWYLPHHAVIHPRKPDKVRVVYDCAAKHQGLSLNDVVHQGPDFTNKLIGVLLRFREECIAVTSDIEGMFQQVRVSPPDRNFLRFLWWDKNEINGNIKTYRMTTHLFGGKWSPSCANFALKRTAKEHQESFDVDTIQTVDQGFYVDDCLKSVATEEKAIPLVNELRILLELGGFRLTKWLCNSRSVMKSVPEEERAKTAMNIDLDKDSLPTDRVLGVLWSVETDSFSFSVNIQEKPLTKRGLLSLTSSIYDPLGFVSPYVLNAKLLFQTLCRRNIGWDEKMPSDIASQWKRWLDDLPTISELVIPRCLTPASLNKPIKAQLHHFADASELGYGAVSFLRLEDPHGAVHCSLVMAKAKLAPLKTTTIPRLELSAALVATKMDQTITTNFNMTLQESVYWSDSMVVLQYIRNEDKRFQVFVANRIAQIREQSSPSQWRHIGTKDNPADELSRGMNAKELTTSKRWIEGPSFLSDQESSWPPQPDFVNTPLPSDAEIKRESCVYQTKQQTTIIERLIASHSSWHKLKRSVVWILRAKELLRNKANRSRNGKFLSTEPISVDELKEAETAILQHVQESHFNDATALNKCQKLSPFKSKDGLIKVGGRLSNADISEEAKHPILLPHDHHINKLIIEHYHVRAGHSGVERILGEIRQRFWIVRGRLAVKSALRQCMTCKKLKTTPECQQMADLPRDRVTSREAPFTHVGVDCFGPFIVRRARSDIKRYGCIFTCLVTRAIHIEVCQDLGTDSFINSLQRFIARRGPPADIRSDNGTNLFGAQRELRSAINEWNNQKIGNYLLQKEIQWRFNTPTASHTGGAWERQIRTVRSVLNSMRGHQTLDDEGLSTLMCTVEQIVNGRPITKLSDDPRDPSPLTPNHLLLLRAGPQFAPGHFVERDIHRRRWRQVQYLSDVFWRRWLKEYIPSLQERQKWWKPKRNLQPGDLVLMCCENTPRYQWPLALITAVYPGEDGKVRSVQIKTQTGLFDRPINKMCLLEAGLVDKP